MPTINQLIRKGRSEIAKKSSTPPWGIHLRGGGLRQSIYYNNKRSPFRFKKGGQGSF